ncbi:hypothetical protein L0128_12885 [candidate division KSB1 bacterium]|nr:hypothetical protein [candidate division KSB1 bacterium]
MLQTFFDFISRKVIWVLPFLLTFLWLTCSSQRETGKDTFITDQQIASTVAQMVEKFGAAQPSRIETGVKQAAEFWQASDGTPTQFSEFCTNYFIADTARRQQTFTRLEAAFEQINGHFTELGRELKWHLEVETGPLLPIDYLLGEYSPGVHTTDDLFKTKIAFVILLNFPQHTLAERLQNGANWTRAEWAADRLVNQFRARVPAAVAQKTSNAYLAADNYISEYNIYLENVLTAEGKKLFPPGKKLITHWGLRDELKANYADPKGLTKQRLIQQIMLRIINQDIPAMVINNPQVDWNPVSNQVFDVGASTPKPTESEPNRRYQHLLNIFQAEQEVDRFYPELPTLIDRKFQLDREMPEEKIKTLFTDLLTAPVIQKIAARIQERLGRPLEPFDIWYDGFKPRGQIQEARLDQITRKKYPTTAAFQQDLPNILRQLGFTPATAAFLASKIQIDASRGVGHAAEGGRRSDKAHLRTRVAATGMTYKGFNIAIHELGHNVEQVFSLNRVDHFLLRGVPNNAFTEAFAFVFQSRDLDLLGLKQNAPDAASLNTLDIIWNAYEIAGVALVDMAIWHWLYAHPAANAAELRTAVLEIANGIWNQYYAPVLGHPDTPLLAIYSHIIAFGLYMPDYPLGHIIDFQIESFLQGKNLGQEMERMCRLGRLTPDQWMQTAVGEAISVQPMLNAEGIEQSGKH